MDQVKIGKFIAKRRKSVGLTQSVLAEKLGVSDRAVSKWETGKSMPDSALMLKLSSILEITVNELLSGEEIGMENYKEKYENNLKEMAKQKERADKRLLDLEIVLGVLMITLLLVASAIASYVQMEDWIRIVIIAVGLVLVIAVSAYMIKIEQVAGYYECKNCHHRYVPTLKSMWLSAHMGRTRKLRCPKCGQKTWSKKVIGKGDLLDEEK